MANIIYKPDIIELVFATKNKEYGAYLLRKLYEKHSRTALWLAIILFTLAVSSPIIIMYVTPKEPPVKLQKRFIDATQLGEAPSIKENAPPPPQVEAPPPLKATIKFLPPVIKKDNEVAEEYIPTQQELKVVDAGKKTEEGNADGIDYSLIEVQQKQEVVEEKREEVKQQVYTFVEVMPQFPGGEDALLQYLFSNIKYPEIAKRAGVEGRVIATFVVGKNGEISDVSVVKNIGAGCDEEAIRVIRSMPRWKPGKQNGLPVSVRMSVPISFKLQN
jgi:protein TonB